MLGSLDEKSTGSTTEDADDDVKDDLKVVPICHILDLEHYNLMCAVGVKELERQCSHNAAEKGAEERLGWEEVRDFLETEENTS